MRRLSEKPTPFVPWRQVVLVAIIVTGILILATGIVIKDLVSSALGIALALAGGLGGLSIRFSSKSVKQEKKQDVSKSKIGGHVIQSGRDTIINPPQTPQPTPPDRIQYHTGESEDERTVEVYFDQAVQLLPKEDWHTIYTWNKDTFVEIEVNGDDYVLVELLTPTEWEKKTKNKVCYPERSSRSGVRNVDIEYEVRRTGDWIVWVKNDSRNKQHVGIRITGA